MKKPKVVICIQARIASTRLPEKVLKKVLGKELLLHMINRVKKAKYADEVVVITSSESQNDPIADFCILNSIDFYRGSENDLLDRHYQAAKLFNADFVVKVPSDCPLTDPTIIDKVISLWLENQNLYDYVSNYHPPTFPDGLDVEGFSMSVLEKAWKEAEKPLEREHTTPYIWDNPQKFKIGNVLNPHGNMFLSHRWCVDYEEDFLFVKNVFEEFENNPAFLMEDVLTLLEKKPELAEINKEHSGVNWYRNCEGQLKTVGRHLYRKNESLNLQNSGELLDKAQNLIPCATQTLSKGYTQWSQGVTPLFIDSAKGCEVTDVDGNVYIDYGMALGPFILGYSDPDVNKAVSDQLEKGTMFTLPHPLEIDVAELIVENVPCAEMVRFGKNGSDATAAAVKLARAFTQKEKIITCGYHGWQDWYIVSTERNAGIPKCLHELVIPLQYNRLDMLEDVLAQSRGEIAALIMEPVCATPPENGFLEEVRRITREHNVILIFDELFTGFRWAMGGAQEYFNVIPDLACFGKAMANGMPISCIAGKRELMEKFEDVFFSFTYGGETLSLAGTIATIKKLKEKQVHKHVTELGGYFIDEIQKVISMHNVNKFVSIMGYPFKSVFMFNGDKYCTSLELKSFFQQECAKRGVLFIGYHLISYAHKKDDIDFTVNVYEEIMAILKEKIRENKVRESLNGSIVTQIFKNVGDRSSN